MAKVSKNIEHGSEKDLSVLLSNQEQEIMESILSIQDFYQLKDHVKLIHIILNKKQSEKVFGEKRVMISDVFEKQKDHINEDTKVNIFAEKYSYKDLVEKFRKPKSFRNNLLIKILAKKMEKRTIESHQTRKNIWMLASGALFSMKNNQGLYQGLISYPDYPTYYVKSIFHDLNRTVKNGQTHTQDMTSLKSILTAFSRRNPYIGYCQGLNFIAYFLMTMQFSDQQSFWILSQITQTIIPMDYYTNMVGVACDQQIFLQILSILKPKITNKFKQVGLDGTVICIQWFVCLFTSSLPFSLVKIVWDRLLVEGTQAFIKAGIIIISQFQKQILQTSEFYEIIMIVETGSKQLKMSDEDFNKQFDKIYICTKGLKIARDLYRQFHIKEKLQDRMLSTKKKVQKSICNPQWPLCTQALNQVRKTSQQIQIWTYRQESSPKIIHDYLETIKQTHKDQKLSKSTVVGSDEKIILSKNQSVKNSMPCEYVIGRMEHICHQQYQSTFMHKNRINKKKHNNKFLSMIVEGEEDDEGESKRIENFKKIIRQSTCEFRQLDEGEQEEGSNNNVKKPEFKKSQTIEFYAKFVQNNKQLAEMLIGKSQIFKKGSSQTKQPTTNTEQAQK